MKNSYGPSTCILCHLHRVLILLILSSAGLLITQVRLIYGDTWNGAGENPATQIRDWNNPLNWQAGFVPPGTDQNLFDWNGEGTVCLNGQQQASGMFFNDFTYTIIAPNTVVPPPPPPPYNLTLVDPPAGGPSTIQVGEGVRDTYGADYFTAGPQFTADVFLNNKSMSRVDIGLGSATGNGSDSAVMFSGQLTNLNPPPNNDALVITGSCTGASMWVSSNNNFNGSLANHIVVAPGGGGLDGYTLHLVNSGRMDFTPIELQMFNCFLGLHDNTGGGAGGVQFPGNAYNNWVWSTGGNVFADRSYQISDVDTTVNVLQYLVGGLTIYQGLTNFGTPAGGPLQFGRTNNGFSVRLATLDWQNDCEIVSINVNNGNLTEGRGGSRYVSGANRLQEAHNYTYVDMLIENAYGPGNQPLAKGGTGVLAIDLLNNGVPGAVQNWVSAPMVGAGVLRLGTMNNPHNAPWVNLVTPDAGVGIGWDTQINLALAAPVPFSIQPGGANPGQCGAVDVDLWNFGLTVPVLPTIDTNLLDPTGIWTYLRIGSSMGGDATFDPQPLASKHASVVFQNLQGLLTQIVPYHMNPDIAPIYYFGGGGGTLRVDTQLSNWEEQIPTDLEMGTTGNLLPGRVALNPGLEDNPDEPNLYTGVTLIRAGTLQLMKENSVYGTAWVSLGTYDQNISQALYKQPVAPATWEGPGQLLLDPGRDPRTGDPLDWDLNWYTTQIGGNVLRNTLSLDGGVIGWTGNVKIPAVPGQYGATLQSDLTGVLQGVNVLGLGGEYSAGTMFTTFPITDNMQEIPVLLYKAGKNSVLDLRQTPVGGNTYTGGTIIAGGTIVVDNPNQLNAGEDNPNGGPILILNGGRLQFMMDPSGTTDQFVNVPIMVNTAGTPDTVKNCGSVVTVADNLTVWLMQPFDFKWNPGAYLEKSGPGTLSYEPLVSPLRGPANAWGLKLTDGMTTVNQMPVSTGTGDAGPLVCNNGNLTVRMIPAGLNILDTDPGYGFRCLISMKGTVSSIYVDDDALFRTQGSVPNEILGTVNFIGQDTDSIPGNNIVDLSRNMASAAAQWPAAASRGDGAMTFSGVTVYMSGGGPGNILNVLPQEAGFILQLNDGVVFNASHQNNVCGEVQFNNVDTTQPVQIDGEEANPATPLGGPPYTFNLVADVWTIYGTGLTTWSGTTQKVGPGTVSIIRSPGAPVLINSNTLLLISGGTFQAGGLADPFTDTTDGGSLTIQNDSTAAGLQILQGTKTVYQLTGVGNTLVTGNSTLVTTKLVQNTLTVSAGSKVIISPAAIPAAGAGATPVPEPSTWVLTLLALAVLGGLLGIRRKRVT